MGPATDYCAVIPEPVRPDTVATVRRNARATGALVRLFADDPSTQTLYEVFEQALVRCPDSPYLGSRSGAGAEYTWMTYQQSSEARNALGSGMVALLGDVFTGRQEQVRVGIYAHNSVGWMLSDLAIHAYGMTCVPLYDTLGRDAVEYIVQHAELSAVCCSVQTLDKLVSVLPKCPTVKAVVVFGTTRPQERLSCGDRVSGCVIRTMDRVQDLGQRNPSPHRPPAPGDVALINYTSGTTGLPKGAILTHRALVANCAGSSMVVADVLKSLPEIRHISYLPLAHVYERFNVTLLTYHGGAIGFYRGDVLTLLDDIEALKPTTFASVPRLFNRIHDAVMAQIGQANPVARKIFWTAYNYKKAHVMKGDGRGGPLGPVFDKLVFDKIRAKLGGRVQMMSSGASPISPEVFLFLRVVFGGVVLEGYGMTETACLITLTVPGDPVCGGHVGAVIPSCEVKLVDIPEMNYSNMDSPYPRGEICVRGPILFSGYLKNEAATRETIDETGWLHTGDVGMFIEGGRLRIFDRKKAIFKLAQGEYISPERIEAVHTKSPLILQSFVWGDSLSNKLVAIIVPDPDRVIPWAKERRLSQDMGQLISSPVLLATIMKSVQEESRSAGLNGFEHVAAIRLHQEPFSTENGLMTPTFKIKRNVARDVFSSLIQEMYDDLRDAPQVGRPGA